MTEGMDDLIRLASRFTGPRVTPHPDQRRRWGEVQRILEEIKAHNAGPSYVPPAPDAPTEVIEIKAHNAGPSYVPPIAEAPTEVIEVKAQPSYVPPAPAAPTEVIEIKKPKWKIWGK